MGVARWLAAPDGRYWIDVAIAGQAHRLMVDTGIVDARHRLGIELEATVYDWFRRGGLFLRTEDRQWRDASGRQTKRETGLIDVRLLDPQTLQPIGPAVQVYASRGAVGLPSRVGVVFFHALAGCRVIWELQSRIWSIEYP